MAYPYPQGQASYGQYGGGYPGQGGWGGQAQPTQGGWGGQAQPTQGGWGGQAQPTQGGWGVNPQIQQWFSAVDTDKSGRITAAELQRALVNGNWTNFSEEACRMMISLFDRDRSGTIDVNEFQGIWNYMHQWKAVFEKYDANKTGQIEQEELQRALTEMGYRLSPQFIASVISKYDPRNRTTMTLDTFIVFCVHMRLLTEAFRAKDTGMTGTITINYEEFLGIALFNRP